MRVSPYVGVEQALATRQIPWPVRRTRPTLRLKPLAQPPMMQRSAYSCTDPPPPSPHSLPGRSEACQLALPFRVVFRPRRL